MKSIFPVCQTASRTLDSLVLALILFSGWVGCSFELELESTIVGQEWMPSRLQIVYIQNHREWLSLSSSSFSFTPAAAVHHKQDPSLAHHKSKFFLFLLLFVFLLLFFLPLLGVSSNTEMTNPTPSIWDVHRHNTSTWQTSHCVLVTIQQCTGI